MTLWLLRHGEAESRVSFDEQRRLTINGLHEVHCSAMQLVGKTIDLILYSPYVRAKQTADIVIDTITYQGKIQQAAWITPEDDPLQAITKLAEFPEKNILVVSHQPLLGMLAALLTEGTKQFPFVLTTGELLTLEGNTVGLDSMKICK